MTLRLTLIVATAIAVTLFLGGGIGLALHWRKEAAEQRARADAAVAQTGLESANAATVDHYHETTRVIVQTSEKAAHEVETIPSDNLDPAIRERWIAGLRNQAAKPVDDHGGAQPAR